LGKTFTPQIAKSINDTMLGMQALSPAARKKETQFKNTMLYRMVDAVDSFGLGSEETDVIKSNLKAQAEDSLVRADRRSRMSARELIYDDMIEE
jgi:hypothetical protein